MIRGEQYATKRAWANFAVKAEEDRISALLALYSDLVELGADDAADVGIAGIDALLDDGQVNEASRLSRAVSISKLEKGKPVEALEILDRLQPQWFWLEDLEAGLIHYLRGDAMSMLNRRIEASEEYAKSVERLADHPKSQGYSLVELADTQVALGDSHAALRNLSRAADIFSEQNEPGVLGLLRTKQGAALIRTDNFSMAKKLLREGAALLRLADWGAQLDWNRLNVAFVSLFLGDLTRAGEIAQQLWQNRGGGQDARNAAAARAILIAVHFWNQELVHQDDVDEVATLLEATGSPELAEKLVQPGSGGLKLRSYLEIISDCVTLS